MGCKCPFGFFGKKFSCRFCEDGAKPMRVRNFCAKGGNISQHLSRLWHKYRKILKSHQVRRDLWRIWGPPSDQKGRRSKSRIAYTKKINFKQIAGDRKNPEEIAGDRPKVQVSQWYLKYPPICEPYRLLKTHTIDRKPTLRQQKRED